MEADSTTCEKNSKTSDQPSLPFSTGPSNLALYKEFISNNGDKSHQMQIVERLQNFGLIPNIVRCPNNQPDCEVICRPARVVDRVQWICKTCGKRQPIREGSFFYRLQCSILKTLQIILAWCEDADHNVAAEFFDVKPKVASHLYERLDELAIREYNKHLLGGENSVVLAELYPDCLNRLSPDTTEQPHMHRILMLVDTNHIPAYYRLHVLREDLKKSIEFTNSNEYLQAQIEDIIESSVLPNSLVVVSNNVPPIGGAVTLQHLAQHCDIDTERFLNTRIWRQAVSICAASRDICARAGSPVACALAVQHYLHSSMYRLRFDDGFYRHTLNVVAEEYTIKTEETDKENLPLNYQGI